MTSPGGVGIYHIEWDIILNDAFYMYHMMFLWNSWIKAQFAVFFGRRNHCVALNWILWVCIDGVLRNQGKHAGKGNWRNQGNY